MKFKYSGLNRQTKQREQGQIQANSKTEVLDRLRDSIEIYEITLDTPLKGRRKKVKRQDLVVPMQELATLCESGVTLIDALIAVTDNDENPEISDGFSGIVMEVESGKRFSEALATSSMPFPDYAQQLVKAGEASGQLAQALRSITSQMEYDQAIKNDMRSALAYPLILIFSGLAAMLIIFFAVVPKFSHLLNSEKELPALAYAVLSTGQLVNESPGIIIIGLFAIIALLAAVFVNPTVQLHVKEYCLHLPIIGPWLAEQDAAKWSALAAALLQSRVSLVLALELASEGISFKTRKDRAKVMVSSIESGESFNDALKKANLVSSTSLNLISVGDKTGNLGKMLQAVAELHDAACKRKMKQVLTLMEPLAILLVGVIIGVMVLGIVLAITASTDIAI